MRADRAKGEESTQALVDAAWAAGAQPGGIFGYVASDIAPVGGEELLVSILYILRNSSFVPRNGRSIGHSSRLVQVFKTAV